MAEVYYLNDSAPLRPHWDLSVASAVALTAPTSRQTEFPESATAALIPMRNGPTDQTNSLTNIPATAF